MRHCIVFQECTKTASEKQNTNHTSLSPMNDKTVEMSCCLLIGSTGGMSRTAPDQEPDTA